MESEMLEVAESAIGPLGSLGYICVDKKGLCLSVAGQVSQSMSGIIHQIATLAERIDDSGHKSENKDTPVIRVDLERTRILIKSQDEITTALIFPQK